MLQSNIQTRARAQLKISRNNTLSPRFLAFSILSSNSLFKNTHPLFSSPNQPLRNRYLQTRTSNSSQSKQYFTETSCYPESSFFPANREPTALTRNQSFSEFPPSPPRLPATQTNSAEALSEKSDNERPRPWGTLTLTHASPRTGDTCEIATPHSAPHPSPECPPQQGNEHASTRPRGLPRAHLHNCCTTAVSGHRTHARTFTHMHTHTRVPPG